MLQAQELLRRGCFWNMFVTAGRASTFLDVLCTGIPNVVLAINDLAADVEGDREAAAGVFAIMATMILSETPCCLSAIRSSVPSE